MDEDSMPSRRLPRQSRNPYLVALAITAGAEALNYAYGTLTGAQSHFLIFYPAVVLASWHGGTGPGLAVAGAGVVLTWLLDVAPHNVYIVATSAEVFRALVFVVSAVLIIALNENLRRALRRAREAEDALRVSEGRLARHNEELEARVSERTKELTAALEEQRAFSYALSHDLRAPLRAISGYTHHLERRLTPGVDAESRALVERLAQSALRLERFVHDLHRYATLGQAAAAPARVDLDAVVANVLDGYPPPEAAEVRVRRPLGSVLGTETLVAQVVANLIGNAVKFTPPGQPPSVEVWSEPHDGRLRLCVSDNGIGIPREAQERVFQPFQRLHPPGAYEGTGIGLAIVKKSVERMGGACGLESEPMKGSRFWVELQGG